MVEQELSIDKIAQDTLKEDKENLSAWTDEEDEKGNSKGKLLANKVNSPEDQNNENSTKDKEQEEERKVKVWYPRFTTRLFTVKEFYERQYDDAELEEVKTQYAWYKETWLKKESKQFFENHKNEEWFKEKYNPSSLEQVKAQVLKENKKKSELLFEMINENKLQNINLEIDDEKTPINLETNKPPYFISDFNDRILFIKSIPKQISRFDIIEACQNISGFQSIILSEPFEVQDFARFGWLLFSTPLNKSNAYEELKNLVIKEVEIKLFKQQSKNQPIKTTQFPSNSLTESLDLCKQLIDYFDKKFEIQGNPLLLVNDEKTIQELDKCVYYLRFVHSYCFFCNQLFENERQMSSKCGPVHLRLPCTEIYDQWKSHLQRIKAIIIIKPEEPIIKEQSPQEDCEGNKQQPQENCEGNKQQPQENCEGNKQNTLEEKLEKFLHEQFEMQKDNNPKGWPCILCEKMFKEEHFLKLHCLSKHQTDLDAIRVKLNEEILNEAFFNNYCQNQSQELSEEYSIEKFNFAQCVKCYKKRIITSATNGTNGDKKEKESQEYNDLDTQIFGAKRINYLDL